ncbi:MAG: GDP-L-fucose synthase [Phycisphaerae bacterium]|nr:GDP-L-fucose synthase [Phycisphaerae bacterium]
MAQEETRPEKTRSASGPRRLLSRHRRLVVFLVHGLLFVTAFAGAFLLRFDFRLTYGGGPGIWEFDDSIGRIKEAADQIDRSLNNPKEVQAASRQLRQEVSTLDRANRADRRSWLRYFFLSALPILLAIKLSVFGAFRLYDGWWRYAGFKDLLAVFKASYVATLIFFMLVYVQWMAFGWLNLPPLISNGFPRSIYLLDLGLTIGLVGGARLIVRLWHEEMRPIASGGLTRLLIVGAGGAGTGMLHEIQRMPIERYRVVGFVDDDPAKQNARIMGIPVLGAVDEIGDICRSEKIEEILIAIPSATRRELQRIVDHCQGTSLRFRTVPAISDLIDGRVSVSQIKEVDINDLLGREPVNLDREGIGAFLHGRTVVITGAGGSIGSEMCRQVAEFGPGRLVLIEQAENNLFHIERELRAKYESLAISAYICDIADRRRTQQIFLDERPAVVFHAAAHKHVPLMEVNPGEAIKNNVFGTKSVADAAGEVGVEKFVMISTDKAVNPTSVMGCSKRVAEIYIQNLGRHYPTQYVTVRFGNVLGSAGSVVPIFKAQIAAGGPVTITDARMVRYFMTIPEASQLVLQAGTMGSGGEIFVLDMGEPVRIVDLARTMITLSGFRPDEDIEIREVGRRPGEKLFEELSIKGEGMSPTVHPKILAWKNVPYSDRQVEDALGLLKGVTDPESAGEVIDALRGIVPEYHPHRPGDTTEAGSPALASGDRSGAPAPAQSPPPLAAPDAGTSPAVS